MPAAVQSDAQICNIALRRAAVSQTIASLNDPSTEAAVLNDVYGFCRDRALAAVDWPFARRRAYLAALGGPAWAPAQAYVVGAFVSYSATSSSQLPAGNPPTSTVYVATAASTGAQPDISPASWTKVSRDDWAYVYPLPPDMVVTGARKIFNGSRTPTPENDIPFSTEDDATLGYPVLLCDVAPIGNQAPLLMYTAQLTDPARFSASFIDALAWLLAVELATAIRKDSGAARAAEQAFDMAIGRAISDSFNGQRQDQPPVSDFISGR
jgi:hypothetical protein